jgi:hypothetical protein
MLPVGAERLPEAFFIHYRFLVVEGK